MRNYYNLLPPPSCDCVPEVANIRKTGQEKDEEGTWNCYYYCMYVPALIITGLLWNWEYVLTTRNNAREGSSSSVSVAVVIAIMRLSLYLLGLHIL